MYDEEETVEVFYDRGRRALDGVRFELILVDDASRDRTPALCSTG